MGPYEVLFYGTRVIRQGMSCHECISELDMNMKNQERYGKDNSIFLDIISDCLRLLFDQAPSSETPMADFVLAYKVVLKYGLEDKFEDDILYTRLRYPDVDKWGISYQYQHYGIITLEK